MENEQLHQQLFPDEITMEILSRLPADSALQCRRVCRAWRSIIEEDPVFHDMHIRRLTSSSSARLDSFVVLESVKNSFSIEHYVRFVAEPKHNDQEVMRYNKRWKLPFIDTTSEIHHRSLAIVGSCNGLICISTIPDYDINGSHYTFVCNPWTREVVNLSDSSINSNRTSSSTSTDEHELLDYSTLSLKKIGFGYLPSTNEFKIVRIYSSEERMRHVQVYTLGSGCGWRTIVPQISWSDITFSINYSIREVSKLGVSVNGALYFNNRRNIVSFDLAKEEFKIIIPPVLNSIDGLGVLGGCLCATQSRFSTNNSTVGTDSTDLWVMEKDHKDNMQEKEESWIKKFSFPQAKKGSWESFFRYIPLGGALAPPRILLQKKWKKWIVSYNPETHKSCYNDISYENNEMLSSVNQIIPYVKSCVFLKTLGENVQIKESRSRCC